PAAARPHRAARRRSRPWHLRAPGTAHLTRRWWHHLRVRSKFRHAAPLPPPGRNGLLPPLSPGGWAGRAPPLPPLLRKSRRSLARRRVIDPMMVHPGEYVHQRILDQPDFPQRERRLIELTLGDLLTDEPVHKLADAHR